MASAEALPASPGGVSTAAPPRKKRIVLLFDGTAQDDNAKRRDSWTNVVRMRDLIDTSPDTEGIETVWWYSTGVGALDNSYRESGNPDVAQHYTPTSWLDRIEQLVYGYGTMERVRQAYFWLCHNYQPGDLIYCFGFSRGGFSARCFAGLIAYCGIIDVDRVVPENGATPRAIDRLIRRQNSGNAMASATGVDAEHHPHMLRADTSVPQPLHRLDSFGARAPERVRFDLQRAFGVRDMHSAVTLAMNTATNACRLGLDPVVAGPHGWPVLEPVPRRWHDVLCKGDASRRLSAPSMTPPDFRALLCHPFDEQEPFEYRINVRMVGVFDTVPALSRDDLAFYDPSLRAHIDSAYHALAIDEARGLFQPLLWDVAGSTAVRANRRLQQVWFCGDHTDVGGGWSHQHTSQWIPVSFADNKCPPVARNDAGEVLSMRDQPDMPQWLRVEPSKDPAASRKPQFLVSADHALSIVTLNWMLEAAEHEGLKLKEGWRLTPDSLRKLSQMGVIHTETSFKKVEAISEPTLREIDTLSTSIHVSVLCRMADTYVTYSPDNPESKRDSAYM